jgi:hypothetical protein
MTNAENFWDDDAEATVIHPDDMYTVVDGDGYIVAYIHKTAAVINNDPPHDALGRREDDLDD